MTGGRLPQRLVAEGVGTGLLLAAVVGSGIMADRPVAAAPSLAQPPAGAD